MSPAPTPISGTSRPHTHEETTVTTTETPLHIRQAEGLRALADFIEQHGETKAPSYLDTLNVWCMYSAAEMAALARAALRAGAKVDKDVTGEMYNLDIQFGPVTAKALAMRNEVCERVQIGTETVTRKERDADAVEAALADIPENEVTEEVPVYEWQCKPLLAAGTDAEAAAR